MEEGVIVERQVSGGDGYTPFVAARLRLAMAVDDLKEGGHRFRIMGEKNGLLPFLYLEIHVLKQHGSILFHCAEVLHLQNLIAGLAFHLENDTGILAR